MIPLCIDQGVGVTCWRPLARGTLAGTRTREGERRTTRAGNDPLAESLYSHPSDFDVADRVMQVATERDVPPAQVAGLAAASARRVCTNHRRDEERACP
jgi:aryl-alcohol dehydrogenase-like predicted oxidoreductase